VSSSLQRSFARGSPVASAVAAHPRAMKSVEEYVVVDSRKRWVRRYYREPMAYSFSITNTSPAVCGCHQSVSR
jgi:hypothetical protein